MRRLTLVAAAVALAVSCGSPTAAASCAPTHRPGTGELADDMVGRWQLVRHYTDERFYDFAADGTVIVVRGGRGVEPTTHETTWRVDDLRILVAGDLTFAMVSDETDGGVVWRAPLEYILRTCR